MNALQIADLVNTLANMTSEEHQLFKEECKKHSDGKLRSVYVTLTRI